MVIVGGPSRDYFAASGGLFENLRREAAARRFSCWTRPSSSPSRMWMTTPRSSARSHPKASPPNKDLVLDTSGVGQLYGLGPEIALVSSYGTHPLVGSSRRSLRPGFPIARALEIKNGDKTAVEKLFESTDDSFATTNLAASEIRRNLLQIRRGPFVLGAAGTYNSGKEGGGGRFVVVGSSSWVGRTPTCACAANRDLFLEHDELALIR